MAISCWTLGHLQAGNLGILGTGQGAMATQMQVPDRRKVKRRLRQDRRGGKTTLPWIPRRKTNINRMVFTSRLTGSVGIPPPTGSERGRTQVGTRGQRRMEVR